MSAGKRYTIVKRAPRTVRCVPCGRTVNRLEAYRTPLTLRSCKPCAIAGGASVNANVAMAAMAAADDTLANRGGTYTGPATVTRTPARTYRGMHSEDR